MATGTQGQRQHGLDKAKPSLPTGRRRRADGKPKKNFLCQACQKAFNSLEKLKVHSYSHTGERPYRCSNLDCTKAFVSKYKLLRHMATHSPEKNHKCSYCEKMFHRKDHLKNHLHTHDPYKEAFACQECGKSYNTKLGFKRHLALHSANSGDLTCQVCLQPFPSTAVLLEHLKTHAGKSSGGTKEKKHRCEHCERRFYTRKDVRRHMVVHTGRKDFLCQYCAQRFGRKDHLTRHVKKSHAQELLRVKTEPADSLEPVAYELGASGGSIIKGELPGMLAPPRTHHHQLNMYTAAGMPLLDATEAFPSHTQQPFSLKYPLGAAHFTSYGSSSLSFSQEREQHLKGELESYLMELQSSMPSSSAVPQLEAPGGSSQEVSVPLSKLSSPQQPAAAADSLASSSSLMDFSQLFNFLPLNGPPYSQAGGTSTGGGEQAVTYPPSQGALPLGQLASQQPPQDPEPPSSSSSSSFISNLSTTPTTLPRFHQAFQ